jgi:hypothetical protein
MRFIKLGIISIVFLFLVVTAMSLLLPSTVNISRAVDINAPFDSIYNSINDVSKWKNWYANFDSANVTLSQQTVGKGAVITVNNTRVTILSSDRNKIKTSWQFGKKSLEGDFNLFKHDSSNVVTVQWHFTQQLNWYPWEKFASIVSDKVMSPGMEKSLDNLKKAMEH